MSQRFFVWLLLCFACAVTHGQDLDGVQVHGFAAQGFLYSTHNNWLVSDSSNGTPDWTEAAVSFNARPVDKVRVGVQLHYYELSDLGSNGVTIDWAMGEYKLSEKYGIRAGKVKVPIGLFNDTQDIDPVLLWSLLPQSVYQLDNRDFNLSIYGGEFFGAVPIATHEGKLSYRVYGGANKLPLVGGFGEQLADGLGVSFDDPLAVKTFGGDLSWQTPLKSLTIGTSFSYDKTSGTFGSGVGSISVKSHEPILYAKFEAGRWYAAAEYRAQIDHATIVEGPYTIPSGYRLDGWYAMTSYRPTSKLQVGTYYSNYLVIYGGRQLPPDSNNSRDLVLSARYDINSNFYAKGETHFLHGEGLEYYPDDNPGGLKSRTNLIVAKLGFSF